MDLSNGNLVGTLPSAIGAWVYLTKFDVSNNRLRGTVPASTKGWSKLKTFYVSGNALSGDLPLLPFAKMQDCKLMDYS